MPRTVAIRRGVFTVRTVAIRRGVFTVAVLVTVWFTQPYILVAQDILGNSCGTFPDTGTGIRYPSAADSLRYRIAIPYSVCACVLVCARSQLACIQRACINRARA